ncbi:MAG: methyltransferase domain-containing protein, partial [Chloroflexi bacterium]|nr:methyltransferase domain-containing protein [Chloroflexota bacterium]
MAHEADYVHGYSEREAERLRDQAASTRDLLHHDTSYPAGHTVLEIGCGVGAQTVTLAKNSPGARILSLDISTPSLEAARATVRREGLSNVA